MLFGKFWMRSICFKNIEILEFFQWLKEYIYSHEKFYEFYKIRSGYAVLQFVCAKKRLNFKTTARYKNRED